jgi:selenocysteine lyase/cysteine desulfurase
MPETIVSKAHRPAQPKPSVGYRDAPGTDAGALAQLLNAGGDSRLRLKLVNNLNDFGSGPLPRPHALSFASSTASSISARAFAAVADIVRTLRVDGRFDDLEPYVESLRAELKAVWGLGADTDVVFAPSGTDAELRALFLAKAMLKPPVVSIVVSSDETGSGMPMAAAGRHFNSDTAGGFEVVKGELVHGLGHDIGAVLIPTQGADGCARPASEIDAAVVEATRAAIAGGSSVILHVMTHSKLGTHAPTSECVRLVAERWGDSVQIIVDACQARVSRAEIQSDLARNRIVLITGSKFFAGPAFSGAVLVPAALAARAAESADIPLGFLKYTCASDWPARFDRLRSLLPPIVNVGQALRWTAALAEMRAYFAVPETFRRSAMREFAQFVTQCIGERPNLRLLNQPPRRLDGDDEFSIPTVSAFLAMRNGRPCSMTQARLLYQALNEDVSALAGPFTPRQRRLLGQCCHIGQPVLIPQSAGEGAGALRVSADARLISESWQAGDEARALERLRANIAGVQVAFDKLQLLIDQLDALPALDAR